MVPIRDVVIFPFTKVAFKIGRPGSIRALEEALASDRAPAAAALLFPGKAKGSFIDIDVEKVRSRSANTPAHPFLYARGLGAGSDTS